jgi:hypothetical protein
MASMRGEIGVPEINLVTDGAKFLTRGVVEIPIEAKNAAAAGSTLEILEVLGVVVFLVLSVLCVKVALGLVLSSRIGLCTLLVEAPRASVVSIVRCVAAGDEVVLTGIRTLIECPMRGEFAPGGIATEVEHEDLAERGTPLSATATGGVFPGLPTNELVKIVRAGLAGAGEFDGSVLLAARTTMGIGREGGRHSSLCTLQA